MTYFPPRSNAPAKPKKCPGCGDWYVPTPGMENTSCCVAHGPGSCCHYSETKVDRPTTEPVEGA